MSTTERTARGPRGPNADRQRYRGFSLHIRNRQEEDGLDDSSQVEPRKARSFKRKAPSSFPAEGAKPAKRGMHKDTFLAGRRQLTRGHLSTQIYASSLDPGQDQASSQAAPDTMFRRLYHEHLLLQRAHDQLLRQTDAKGWAEERSRMEDRVRQLVAQVDSLRQELAESRDQAELLEFCILELQTEPDSSSAQRPGPSSRRPCQMDQSQVVAKLQSLYDKTNLEDSHKKLIRQLIAFFLGGGPRADCCRQVPQLVEKQLQLYGQYAEAREQVQKLISVGSGPSEPGSEDEGLGEEGSSSSGSSSRASGPASLGDIAEAHLAKLEQRCKELEDACARQEREHAEQKRRLEDTVSGLEAQLADCRRRAELQSGAQDDSKKLRELQLELTYKDEIVKSYEEHFNQMKAAAPSKIPVKSSSPLRHFASKISFSHGNLSKVGLVDDRLKLQPLETRAKSKSNFSLHPQRWFRKKSRITEKPNTEERVAPKRKDIELPPITPPTAVEASKPKPSLPNPEVPEEISIKEKLMTLEKNNREFEKDLENRDRICKEKDMQHKKLLEIENRLKEGLQKLETEKVTLIKRTSELMVEKTRLQEQLEKLKVELKATSQNYRQSCETLNLKHNLEEKTLQMKIKSLETQKSSSIQKMSDLQNEKADILSSPKGQQDKFTFVLMTLGMLEEEQNELQAEIETQKEELNQSEMDYRSKLNILEKNYSNEVKTLQKEIECVKNRENDLQNQIIKLNSREMHLSDQLKAKEKELGEARKEVTTRLTSLDEEHRRVEADLQWKLRRIEETAEDTVRTMEKERHALEKNVKEDIRDLKDKELAYKSKISELENSVKNLHREIDQLTGGDCQSLSERHKLAEAESRERQLRQRLEESEKKEEAYKETLVHAEQLVQGYKERAEELERSRRSLQRRIAQLEQSEMRLHAKLREQRRSGQLVGELLEADGREAALRDQIDRYEAQNRALGIRVRELERAQKGLREELSHKDELIQTAEKLRIENNELRRSLGIATQTREALQAALHEASSVLAQRGVDQVALERERGELKETIVHLRSRVQELKALLEKHEEERLSSEVVHHLLSVQQETRQETSSPTRTQDDRPKEDDNEMAYRTYVKKSSKAACPQASTTAAAPLPPPDFRVLRQVGEDGLLVGWRPPSQGTTAACFQLYVNGELQHTTRSPDRTKALLHKLDLSQPCQLSICAVSVSGLRSQPASLVHPQPAPPGAEASPPPADPASSSASNG